MQKQLRLIYPPILQLLKFWDLIFSDDVQKA